MYLKQHIDEKADSEKPTKENTGKFCLNWSFGVRRESQVEQFENSHLLQNLIFLKVSDILLVFHLLAYILECVNY